MKQEKAYKIKLIKILEIRRNKSEFEEAQEKSRIIPFLLL